MIVDPAFLKPVDPGDPGELLVSSEHMVTAYLNKPEETDEAFVELEGRTWYRTADIMSMDDDGNLYFVDRTVDTIKHKGYRVTASEIEAVLQEHPAVIGTCVVGVPDEKVGERIKAYVVLKEDIKGITGYDLLKWCRQTPGRLQGAPVHRISRHAAQIQGGQTPAARDPRRGIPPGGRVTALIFNHKF